MAIISGSYTNSIILNSNPTRILPQAELYGGLFSNTTSVFQVSNEGVISHPTAEAVYLKNGGTFTNTAIGRIKSPTVGLLMSGIAGTVTNAGIITGGTGAALELDGGGFVNNLSTGSLSAAGGVDLQAEGAVINAGIIYGTSRYGVRMQALGNLSNSEWGTIIGGANGIYHGNTSTPIAILNAGIIDGATADGILAKGSVYITNQTSGTIIGGSNGVDAQGTGTNTITNMGTLIGSSQNGVKVIFGAALVTNGGRIYTNTQNGIRLYGGGSVTNLVGGTITASQGGGVVADGLAVTVANYGLIMARTPSQNGIWLIAGGSVSNQNGGTIAGGKAAVYDKTSGIVDNHGLVNGGTYGVFLKAGGFLYNSPTGTITSTANTPVYLGGAPGTVFNSGVISSGTRYAVRFVPVASAPDRLLVIPGAVFLGNVSGGAAPAPAGSPFSILEFGDGSFSGIVSGLGSKYIGFAQTTLDAGSEWTITGTNSLVSGATVTNFGSTTLRAGNLTVPSALINKGLIQIEAGSLSAASLTGTGEVLIGAAGSLTVTGSVASTQTIMLEPGGLLNLLGTVTNAGLAGGGTVADGLILTNAGGRVTNESIGTISGTLVGIFDGVQTAAVVNGGTISGASSSGIFMTVGGSVTNQNAGVIAGGGNGILLGGNAIVTNAGTITGATFYGVDLYNGGLLINHVGGIISGASSGIFALKGGAGVYNTGFVTGAINDGVRLADGGNVTNSANGGLIGGVAGVYVGGAAGTISNGGLVTGISSSGYGIILNAGGRITNQNAGTITGNTAGIYAKSGDASISNQAGGTISAPSGEPIYVKTGVGTVTNAGVIAGGGGSAGVLLPGGGSVTNLSTGTITNVHVGVSISGAQGQIMNAGTISGSVYALQLPSTGLLTVEPGAVFIGEVSGAVNNDSLDTLELASSTSVGTLTGLGSQFINFAVQTIDVGAAWVLNGANTIVSGATLTNAGGLTLANGTLTASGALYNDNVLRIAAATVSTTGSLVNSGNLNLVSGKLTANGPVVNNGEILVSDGNMNLGGALNGTGQVIVGSGGTFVVVGTVASTETITLETGGVMALNETVTNAGAVIAADNSAGVPANANIVAFNNLSGATISGGTTGIYLAAGGVLTNAGQITANRIVTANGVSLPAGGGVTNVKTGTIAGGAAAIVVASGAGAVANSGIITANNGRGVSFGGGGVVINLAGGVISGSLSGVYVQSGAATITNAGSIGGGSGAIRFAAGYTNLLIVNPGAVFTGTVEGSNPIGAGNHISTLELAPGSATGLISGLGSQFHDFAQTTIDTGALWTVTGPNQLPFGAALTNSGEVTILDGNLFDPGTVVNNGVIQLTGGTLGAEALTGTGTVLIGGGSSLTVSNAIPATQTIAFSGAGMLRVQSPVGSFAGQFVLTSGAQVSSQATTDTVSGTAASVIVTGTGAGWTSAGQLQVGGSDVASFAIEGSGTATAAAVTIAGASGASGSSAAVTGSNSKLAVTAALVVGGAGSGALSVSNGGTATAGSLDLAAGATGDGVLSVVGGGSTLTVTGSLIVGDQSTGEMSILGGAQVTVGGGFVGGAGGGSGNLDVEGSGSKLTVNGGTLVVGANGPAVYTLGQGTTQTGSERTAAFGVANLGGLQDPPYITNDGAANLNSGFVGLADIAVLNSGTYTVKALSGTFAPAAVYAPDITFDSNPADNGGSTTGLWVIQNLGTLVLNASTVDASQTFDFSGTNGAKLILGQTPAVSSSKDVDGACTTTGSIVQGAPNVLAGFAAPIQNYLAGDAIVLQGLAYGSATASGDVVTVWSAPAGGGTALGTLTFIDKGGSGISVAAKTEATLAATQLTTLACFAAGTLIETVDGPVKVEDLRVGDRVVTVVGDRTVADRMIAVAADREASALGDRVGDRSAPAPARSREASHADEPIVWLGSRAVHCAAHPDPETVWPVRVRPGAFGENVPLRDLYLSPDHAVFIDDVLIPVKLLINGTSITQTERERITYHHIELPAHAVILAEALAVESYLDLGDRANFADGETIRLFPDFAARLTPDAARTWETKGRAPLVLAGDKLDAARVSVAAVIRPGWSRSSGLVDPIRNTPERFGG